MNVNDLINKQIFVGGKPYPTNSLEETIKILFDGEEILACASCAGKDSNGAISVTNKRVIFYSKTWLISSNTNYNFNQITSVTVNKSFGLASITIDAAGDTFKVTHMLSSDAEVIKKKIDEMKYNLENKSETNDLEQLEKLAELKDKGIITEEDFNKKKKDILGL